ncbi:hypothetical protein ACH5RR_014162 [Cinchona calisaya]|uniref:Trichome birefringence-like N-terminal domain-containing protein n=1 Tax=Cinchona calisaya TaxID=153742 RepID=A0ABD3A5H3_9GENT
MKLQASELPLGKPQTRRKTPKIAPLLITLTALFTFIPLYYPSLRYNINNPKKLNNAATTSFDGSNSDITTTTLEQNNAGDQILDSPKETTEGDDHDQDNINVEMPENPKDIIIQEDEESAITTELMDPKRLPSSTKSGLAIAESLDKKTDETIGRNQVAGPRKKYRREKKLARRQPASSSGGRVKDDDQGENAAGRRFAGLISSGECDLFSGEWIENPEGPYYTNASCWAIQEHQNCMKFGRPDTGFLKWRWKPDGCELPIFEPQEFLEIVGGKSIAFVGDSVARNHMQSLICLLSRVVYPEDVSTTTDQNKRWVYKDYNFNISMFWAPYLVRSEKTDNDVTRPFSLYLDEFDEDWTNNIETYDYVIISAGHWFFRPTMFYVDGGVIGCLYCPQENITHLKSSFSYRRAFRTAFRALNSLENYKGVTFLRTFAPSHFEGGPWDKGGDCVRTRPFKRNERVLDDYNLEMYTIQLEELRIAQKEGREKGLRFRLFDATQSMLLRPDGHPSKYGHWPTQDVKLANDCVHWCLPGPMDAWNDFLLELLKREEAR